MSAVEASSELVDGKYYEVVAPRSFSERLMIRARDRIYDDFMRMCRPGRDDAVLDVGVSDVTGDAANVLERRYPWPERITAAGLAESHPHHVTMTAEAPNYGAR